MLKLAARTFDIYDDTGLAIARKVATQLGAVKVAEHEVVDRLQDRQFAIVMKTASGAVLRRLPIHDGDAVKISRAYFDEIAPTLPEELVKQASAKIAAAEQSLGYAEHGLAEEVQNEILERVAYVDTTTIQTPIKRASYAKEVWGLTIDGSNCFPLHDKTLTKTAADRFPITADTLAPHEKFLYARNIAKQASALGIEIPRTSPINLYTNDTVNEVALHAAIEERTRIFKAAGLNTEILYDLRVASGCRLERGDIETQDSWELRNAKVASVRRLPPDQIVTLLQGIDKYAGIGKAQYARGLADPFAACFKRAEAESATLVDGIDLATIDRNKLRSTFDEDFAKEFEANPVQVYSSLPTPIKRLIQEMAQAGESTASQKSGDPTNRLDAELSNDGGNLVY